MIYGFYMFTKPCLIASRNFDSKLDVCLCIQHVLLCDTCCVISNIMVVHKEEAPNLIILCELALYAVMK